MSHVLHFAAWGAVGLVVGVVGWALATRGGSAVGEAVLRWYDRGGRK